ncbi:MAG: EF-Tu/IF-2/RF-3 family GTPase [Promethearchaeota archaeon]
MSQIKKNGLDVDQEKNYLVGLLAEDHDISGQIAGAFGSPGQRSDIQFYDRLDHDLNSVFCAIDPIGYPDKLKSLVQTMMISDYHILILNLDSGITPAIGEIIVAMDIFAAYFKKTPLIAIGNINANNEYKLEELKNKLGKIIGQTALKDAPIVEIKDKDDREKLKHLIIDYKKEPPTELVNSGEGEHTLVDIDHVFPVKGIGTVILGIVKMGLVKASEMLYLIGVNKKVIIRSIQKQDRDFKVAKTGDRVGLAIKGIKPEEIERGNILCTPGLFETTNKLKIKVKVVNYYKHPLSPESARQFHIFIRLASAPFKITKGDKIDPGKEGIIEIETFRPVPCPKSNMLKELGKGIIGELNKFENKLRIVGYFEII